MIKKVNNKGMTLVEIVVVLLIASIIMTITGGILVNSLGYFDTTTKKSLDKQTLDGVLDFISNEITYATDVRVSNTKPDDRDWHYLYVLKMIKIKVDFIVMVKQFLMMIIILIIEIYKWMLEVLLLMDIVWI